MEYFIFCDGSCYNKPGENSTGYAAVLTDRLFATFDNVLNKSMGFRAEGTNNLAEWDALLLGMQLMIEHNGANADGFNSYHILTDSDLIVNQANGNWRVRKQTFWPFYKKFKALRKQANACRISYSIKWISRKQNKIADFYSREANPHYPNSKLDENIRNVRRIAHSKHNPGKPDINDPEFWEHVRQSDTWLNESKYKKALKEWESKQEQYPDTDVRGEATENLPLPDHNSEMTGNPMQYE